MDKELTQEERALFIGGLLFPQHMAHPNQIRTFFKWLMRNIDAVKAAMIGQQKAYWWEMQYKCGIFYCEFGVGKNSHKAEGTTEAEAVLEAAYKALKAEEE